jgi:hypothetical protein
MSWTFTACKQCLLLLLTACSQGQQVLLPGLHPGELMCQWTGLVLLASIVLVTWTFSACKQCLLLLLMGRGQGQQVLLAGPAFW